MTTIRPFGNWVHFDSHNNHSFNEDEDEDEEETLSLCDLPTTTNKTDTKSNSNKEQNHNQLEDFQFGHFHDKSALVFSQNMCHAEEVFFQGRILPLRHSVNSDTGRITRSASMSIVSCRNNRNDPTTTRSNEYKPKIRNQFHSHPSPSPQIRTQSFRSYSHPNPKTTSLWSFLQVGLVKPQEIGLSDLKNRSKSKRFGSHNSSNSSSSSNSNNSTHDQNHEKNVKKKQRLFFGGCKCSAVTINSTVKETVSKGKKLVQEESVSHLRLRKLAVSKESRMVAEGKQTASRHRTFEWLKQLSIEA